MKTWNRMYFGIKEEEIKIEKTPFELFCALKRTHPYAFLFESASEKDQKARFSFVGFAPTKVVTYKDGNYVSGSTHVITDEPLAHLEKELPKITSTTPGLIGGAVGYVSYEYVRTVEKLPKAQDTLDFPDLEFGIFPDCVMFDHHTGRIIYRYRGRSRLQEIRAANSQEIFPEPLRITGSKCSKTKEEFCQDVEKTKEYIKNGEIFQAVLSKRYEFTYEGDLEELYEKLKATNPSPYLFYLSFGKRSIIGSSPENLIRIENREITSFATLAGTIRRGTTRQEDEKLKEELLANPKERAEHLMLVDLTRNDVGKVAAPGTVVVSPQMEVHTYSQVHHIASGVHATLHTGNTCFDALQAIFPAGTVSGAPKIRAMQIITEFEKESRGPYAGAVGYFSSNGNMDFAIGIRTFFAQGNTVYVQTGAGIVHDSDSEKEYEETEHKARALLNVVNTHESTSHR